MNLRFLLITAAACSSFTAMTACARTPDAVVSSAASVAPSSDRIVAVTPTQAATPTVASTTAPKMIVHKSPSCGCCGSWVEHMRTAGFAVEIRDTDDLNPLKERVGVPYGKGSCHTAEVGGYFIEGHVPADDVKRLLAERPDAKGLVLPGMPMGSPGMESPDGRTQAYTVELVGRDGATRTFTEHAAAQ